MLGRPRSFGSQGSASHALAQAFAIGGMYFNNTGVNPATELGYGTWELYAKGRVIIGQDPDDPAYATLGTTLGAATVAAAGSNSAPTFTGSALAGHTHSVTSNVSVGNHSFTQPTISWPAGVPTAANESAHTHSVTSNVAVGDHAAGVTGAASAGAQFRGAVASTLTLADHTHTIPALVHSVTNNAVTSGAGSAHTHTLSWPAGVPTNASGAVDAHSVTNNAVTSGSTSGGTPAGTVSAPAFTGTPTSVIQPSIVLCCWLRTA